MQNERSPGVLGGLLLPDSCIPSSLTVQHAASRPAQRTGPGLPPSSHQIPNVTEEDIFFSSLENASDAQAVAQGKQEASLPHRRSQHPGFQLNTKLLPNARGRCQAWGLVWG
ncbi:uncharacterized protein CIMG_00656 [Coccidioides immitis RS]|uniref:Uncharacterized protein n=1 Tax=Coccidioides immitis (strain RS) TaxID=246410 RepID=J3KHG5_COCIM|nr:uncharacterized protein CIMG_00656 [Coccidioides immitis RS]EAS35302.3 hypothetical protein CIMG_00656 [Coccidioides immitis RS]